MLPLYITLIIPHLCLRLHYTPENSMQVPKDWFLFVIVVAVVAGDILIILIGTATPSLRFTATRIADIRYPVSLVSLYYQTDSSVV